MRKIIESFNDCMYDIRRIWMGTISADIRFAV
jgi:hypothetical protein